MEKLHVTEFPNASAVAEFWVDNDVAFEDASRTIVILNNGDD